MKPPEPKRTPLDQFGYAAAMLSALETYRYAARSSGRTTRMVERVKKGDWIITTDKSANHLRLALKRAGKEGVDVIVAVPWRDLASSVGRRNNVGRVFIDHNYCEAFLRNHVTQVAQDLDRIQEGLSRTWPDNPNALRPGDFEPHYVPPVNLARHEMPVTGNEADAII